MKILWVPKGWKPLFHIIACTSNLKLFLSMLRGGGGTCVLMKAAGAAQQGLWGGWQCDFWPLYGQFHQHFMFALCADILVSKNFKPKTQLCNFCCKNISAKFVRKMLMKSTIALQSDLSYTNSDTTMTSRVNVIFRF